MTDNNWISVKDKEMPYGKEFLCLTYCNSIFVGERYDNCPDEVTVNMSCSHSYKYELISHYMELPKPPQVLHTIHEAIEAFRAGKKVRLKGWDNNEYLGNGENLPEHNLKYDNWIIED